jgi:hypothetical protein
MTLVNIKKIYRVLGIYRVNDLNRRKNGQSILCDTHLGQPKRSEPTFVRLQISQLNFK